MKASAYTLGSQSNLPLSQVGVIPALILARGVEKTNEGETWKTLLLNFTLLGTRFFVAIRCNICSSFHLKSKYFTKLFFNGSSYNK